MNERGWLAYWRRQAEALLGYCVLVWPDGSEVTIECDESDVAMWKADYRFWGAP